jgi:hypothetical protein
MGADKFKIPNIGFTLQSCQQPSRSRVFLVGNPLHVLISAWRDFMLDTNVLQILNTQPKGVLWSLTEVRSIGGNIEKSVVDPFIIVAPSQRRKLDDLPDFV